MNKIRIVAETKPVRLSYNVMPRAAQPGVLGAKYLGDYLECIRAENQQTFRCRYSGTPGTEGRIFVCFDSQEDFECWAFNRQSLNLSVDVVWHVDAGEPLEVAPNSKRIASTKPVLKSHAKKPTQQDRALEIIRTSPGIRGVNVAKALGISQNNLSPVLIKLMLSGRVRREQHSGNVVRLFAI